MSNDKLYFKNLDAIRFIAALMVFLQHVASRIYNYLPTKNTFWQKILYTISDGGAGVSVFFVLSGFLITYLLISEYELNLKISIKNFYIRRVLRIWPLYFLVVFFSFVVYPFVKSMLGMGIPFCSNFWYHLSFLSNFDVMNIERNCPLNGELMQNINWSVSIEEQFYLFWPLIFVLLPKRAWIYAIVLVILGSIGFRILHDNDRIVLYFHTFSVLLDLGMGGLMAYLIKEKAKVKCFFENTSTYTHLALFVISFSLLLFDDILFSFPYGQAIGRIFISISFALIISAQAMTKRESRLNLGHFSFASKWGKYTYGIYLFHPIAIKAVDMVAGTLPFEKTNAMALFVIGVAIFIMTLVMSKLSFMYFESKFLLLKERFTLLKRGQLSVISDKLEVKS